MSLDFLIFEPHGDDALISCNEFLERVSGDHSVRFITLSERSSEEYSKKLGIQDYRFLDLPEVNVYLKSKISTHEYHRAYLKGENTYRKYLSEVYFGQEPVYSRVTEVYEANKISISREIDEFCRESENPVIVYNLGFDHPYHVLVSETISHILEDYPEVPVIRYGDKPYLSKRYVKEMFECHPFVLSKDTTTVAILTRDSEAKLDTFTTCYPTERGLLRFTKDSIISDPDIYVGDISLLKEVFNCEGPICPES